MRTPDPKSKRSQLKKRAKKATNAKTRMQERAVDMYSSGRTLADIGKEIGANASTISRWVKPKKKPSVSERAKRIAPPRAPAPPEDEEEEPEEERSTLENSKRMQRNMQKAADKAAADGNHTAAQRFMRDAAGMSAIIARLEKQSLEGSDVLHLSMQEIEDTMTGVRDRVATLASRPMNCATCSKELSIEYGVGKGRGGPRVKRS